MCSLEKAGFLKRALNDEEEGQNRTRVSVIQSNELLFFIPSMAEYKSTNKTHPPCHNLSSGKSYSSHLEHREDIQNNDKFMSSEHLSSDS